MTKSSNLMKLDNSSIYYARMLLFVFVFHVYWKIAQNSRAFSLLRQHLRRVGVIAEQTKVLLFAKRSDGPIIQLSSCGHEHKQ